MFYSATVYFFGNMLFVFQEKKVFKPFNTEWSSVLLFLELNIFQLKICYVALFLISISGSLSKFITSSSGSIPFNFRDKGIVALKSV